MNKAKTILCMLMICILVVSLTACGPKEGLKADSSSSTGIRKYSLGSGSVGGMFYLMGGGISTLINNKLSDKFMFTTETTGGSTANIVMIQNRDAEIGISMASACLDAINGTADWTKGVKQDKLRGMVALYPSSMTIYCLADKNINSLSDLEGKVVGLGSKGAAMDTTLRVIFDELGIKPKSIHNDGHSATANAVADGVIDAAILFQNAPWPGLLEIEGTKNLKFIALNEDEQNKIIELYSFYTKSQIAGGLYKGAPESINTLDEWNFLVVNADVPEEEVYNMTKAIYENQEELLNIHSCAKYIVPENNLNFNIPLHPGAIKYMKEIGIEVPEELIPIESK